MKGLFAKKTVINQCVVAFTWYINLISYLLIQDVVEKLLQLLHYDITQKRKSCICTPKIRRQVQINGFWAQPCKCTLEKKPDTTLLLHNRTVGIEHILKLRLTFEETSNPNFFQKEKIPRQNVTLS